MHEIERDACFLMGFVDFMFFVIFRQGEKPQKQNKTKRKDNAENKREVRRAYLSATSGGRRWVRSYAADAVSEVHGWQCGEHWGYWSC